jgi:hypothetical protein
LAWRAARTSHALTWLLGYTHRPATDLVEIDITFACNLRCLNCDRSCTQAPAAGHMTVAQVARFIDETRAAGRRWRRVRVMGGEPTLHPDIDEILALLVRWRDQESPDTALELVTNGHGERVRRVLGRVPPGIRVKDTRKTDRFQPKFEAFNLAPADEPLFSHTDFAHGCWISQECGLGLNAHGWYPCAVAGGIDRVFSDENARVSLPSAGDELRGELRRACARCGHFRLGWWTTPSEREPVHGEPQSPSWRAAYQRFERRGPRLPIYGAAEDLATLPTELSGSGKSEQPDPMKSSS